MLVLSLPGALLVEQRLLMERALNQPLGRVYQMAASQPLLHCSSRPQLDEEKILCTYIRGVDSAGYAGPVTARSFVG